MFDYNKKKINFPQNRTIHRWFEQQVRKTPHETAIVFEDKKLTYSELNVRANKLAKVLRKKGVGANDTVGLMVSRSPEMMIGIIGILKSGGAYMPIDTEFPAERIKYMQEDCGTRLLLTQKQFFDKVDNASVQIIDIEDEGLYEGDGSNLQPISTSSDLAYVMYTSGSTGRPKGVMIEHKSVSNFIEAMRNVIDYSGRKTAIAVTSVSFDVSVNDAIIPIVSGLTLILANEEQQKNPEQLCSLIVENNVRMMVTTPSRIKLLLGSKNREKCFSCLTELMIGGEAFPKQLFKQLRELTTARLYNMYGPTETTVWSTFKELTADGEINIGKPLANNRIYILDENKKLMEPGKMGELYIAGEGLARGYINKPEQTCERFVPDTFFPDERMYRTGDLAMYRNDGDIEFCGRVDNQVKVRGYRIELGEIESQLSKHPHVKEALVVARVDTRDEGDGSAYICAYIIGDSELKVQDLKGHLASKLPDYMIPSYFVKLEKIPLNTNGKVDIKELPDPIKSLCISTEYVPPETDIQKYLVEVWSEILGAERIGINDNFFELGGHSLKATMLTSRIFKKFGVNLSQSELFRNETVKKLSYYIASAGKDEFLSIEPAPVTDCYPLSSAQKRLYIMDKFEGSNISYNLQSMLILEGKIDRKQVEMTVAKLMERHEVFRTSFEFVGNEPIQRIHDDVSLNLKYIEISEDELDDALYDFIKPFDLSKAPLMRTALFKLSENKHILVFDMHHIICDGISTVIVAREFADLYSGKILKDLKIRYRDFVFWHNNLLKSNIVTKQKTHWMNVFSGKLPVGEICTDFPRTYVRSIEGDRVELVLSRKLTERLMKSAGDNNCTMYMILLAIYNIVLSKYSGQNDIIVGSGTSGRMHPDVENLAGMFVNTLMMRNQPNGNKTFKEFLNELRDNTLKAFDNQSYPFEKLVEDLVLDRKIGRSPLHDTVFMLQNMDDTDIYIDGLKVTYIEPELKIAQADLELYAYEKNNDITLRFIYCTALYRKETIDKLAKYFLRIAEHVSINQEVFIKDINILDENERENLLSKTGNKSVEIEFDFE
ncbi:non-ribosomal peptide synthetase [Ruminiclostridium papyrosolvens]|uniref:non-ribosomal peptide synthetase n=1 Tax=Ruminiclostridium papyrosolvens TaxID=29362 RepID=UPI000424AFB6|nr:non-ribosomal peptide synthetase [Ruminiclostridium papyrosolvens]